jgi:hypothetical protein
MPRAEDLNRVARLDGYGVRRARDRRQRSAWGGLLGIFRQGGLVFASDDAYSVKAWLIVRGRRDG